MKIELESLLLFHFCRFQKKLNCEILLESSGEFALLKKGTWTCYPHLRLKIHKIEQISLKTPCDATPLFLTSDKKPLR